MSTFLLHPPGLTVKAITMDSGRKGSHAMTTISVGHCRKNMFFLYNGVQINLVNGRLKEIPSFFTLEQVLMLTLLFHVEFMGS